MLTPRRILAIAILLAMSGSAATASEIRDNAGMFSNEAKQKAKAILDRAEETYKVPTTIETVASIGDLTINEATLGRAKKERQQGVYVLLAKKEHKLDEVDLGNLLGSMEHRKEIIATFVSSMKKGDFDAALVNGAETIASEIAAAPRKTNNRRAGGGGGVAVPPAGRNGGGSGLGFFLTIGLIILAVLIGVRLLGALFGGGARAAGGGYGPPPRAGFGGPGYGAGPGYGGGGGGGGFFSGLMGGIGGAVAGNWLYDQFSGRRRDSGYMGGDAGYGGTAPDPNAGEYTDAGGGDWGGDAGGGGDVGGGGGDWGGGGGGDWGGGGGDAGGGDWS